LYLSFEAENYLRDSGFRREVDENCTILGYYATRRGNSIPIGIIFKNQETFRILGPGRWDR
jgi:hypothetical protein